MHHARECVPLHSSMVGRDRTPPLHRYSRVALSTDRELTFDNGQQVCLNVALMGSLALS